MFIYIESENCSKCVQKFNCYRISRSACADPFVGVVPIGLLRAARSESTSQSLSSIISPRELVSPGNSPTAGITDVHREKWYVYTDDEIALANEVT